MPKGKHTYVIDAPGASGYPNASENECDKAAEKRIAAQKVQQNKRRSKTRKPLSRVRTSIWTTHAARRVYGNKPQFHFNVCEGAISTKIKFSSNNVPLHFKNYHKQTNSALVRLNQQNATDDILANEVAQSRKRHARQSSSTKSIAHFLRPSYASSSAGPFKTACQSVKPVVPVKLLHILSLLFYSCATETSPLVAGSPISQGLISIFDGRM